MNNENNKTIGTLFSGNNTYFEIPRYQRKYVWDDKNWKQMLEDINYLVGNKLNHFIDNFVFQTKQVNNKIVNILLLMANKDL